MPLPRRAFDFRPPSHIHHRCAAIVFITFRASCRWAISMYHPAPHRPTPSRVSRCPVPQVESIMQPGSSSRSKHADIAIASSARVEEDPARMVPRFALADRLPMDRSDRSGPPRFAKAGRSSVAHWHGSPVLVSLFSFWSVGAFAK